MLHVITNPIPKEKVLFHLQLIKENDEVLFIDDGLLVFDETLFPDSISCFALPSTSSPTATSKRLTLICDADFVELTAQHAQTYFWK